MSEWLATHHASRAYLVKRSAIFKRLSTMTTAERALQNKLKQLQHRDHQRFSFDVASYKFRPASVLLLLWPEDDDLRLLFTQRPDTLRSHSGQISFPGGKADPEDRDLIETALRETMEEIGVEVSRNEVVGRLDEAWSVSRRIVHSFVAIVPQRPVFAPNPDEVEFMIEANVQDLLRPGALITRPLSFQGIDFTDQTYTVNHKLIWGLTADILTEFLEWIRDTPDPGHRGTERESELRQFLEVFPNSGTIERDPG